MQVFFFSVGLALHMILRINLQLAKNDLYCCYIFIFLMLRCYVWVVCCCVVLCVAVLLSFCLVKEIFLLSREEVAWRRSVNKLS